MVKGSEIRDKYREFISDIDVDKFELQLKTPNIFEILDVGRTEIRHSNFLAWLLDPEGTHGLGKLFLTKFLRGIATSEKRNGLDEFAIEDLNYNNVELRREWRNIDLLIIFDSLVICIENKIDSKDHSDQLVKYESIIQSTFKKRKKVFVYLTPTGDLPTEVIARSLYATYSYQEIIEQFERILSIHGNALNSGVSQYISDYLTTIKRELMKNDKLNELADKIYKNHRELIDFVFENKTDIASELYPAFVKKIENSGWVMGSKHKGFARFLTPQLDEIIPRRGKGWPFKENFLFELNYYWSKNQIVFKTVVSPGEPEVHEILNRAMKAVEGSSEPRGSKWLVHFTYKWKFDVEKLRGADESDIMYEIDKGWTKVKNVVEKVETELLKYKSEFQRYHD